MSRTAHDPNANARVYMNVLAVGDVSLRDRMVATDDPFDMAHGVRQNVSGESFYVPAADIKTGVRLISGGRPRRYESRYMHVRVRARRGRLIEERVSCETVFAETAERQERLEWMVGGGGGRTIAEMVMRASFIDESIRRDIENGRLRTRLRQPTRLAELKDPTEADIERERRSRQLERQATKLLKGHSR